MPIWKLPAPIHQTADGALDHALKAIVAGGEDYRAALIQAISRYGEDRRAEALELAAVEADKVMDEEREYQGQHFGTEGEKLANFAAHTARKIAERIRALK